MSREGDTFKAFLNRLRTYKVLVWGATYREEMEGAERFAPMAESDVASSIINSTAGQANERHAVVIDIDHPTWLIKSSTQDHYHLYIDVPGGIDWGTYENLLYALMLAGVIEPGYHEVSKKRKRTDVRLPWIKKAVPA
jgi:hypothetical protein